LSSEHCAQNTTQENLLYTGEKDQGKESKEWREKREGEEGKEEKKRAKGKGRRKEKGQERDWPRARQSLNLNSYA